MSCFACCFLPAPALQGSTANGERLDEFLSFSAHDSR
jgi:hypothetical protein